MNEIRALVGFLALYGGVLILTALALVLLLALAGVISGTP